jgi:hypothetical protein
LNNFNFWHWLLLFRSFQCFLNFNSHSFGYSFSILIEFLSEQWVRNYVCFRPNKSIFGSCISPRFHLRRCDLKNGFLGNSCKYRANNIVYWHYWIDYGQFEEERFVWVFSDFLLIRVLRFFVMIRFKGFFGSRWWFFFQVFIQYYIMRRISLCMLRIFCRDDIMIGLSFFAWYRFFKNICI